MKILIPIFAIVTSSLFHEVIPEEHALFVKNDILERVRQGSFREYLPPSNTQKPRPFEPVSPVTPPPTGNGIYHNGYPPSGSITPEPPFTIYTNPATGAVTGEGYPSPSNEITPSVGYPTPERPEPTFPSGPSGPSTLPTGYPPRPSTEYPTTGYPPGPTTGYPSDKPGFPTDPPPGYTTGYPSPQPGISTQQIPTVSYPAEVTTTTQQPGFPTYVPSTQSPATYTTAPTGYPTSGIQTTTTIAPQTSTSEHFTSAVSTTPEGQPVTTTEGSAEPFPTPSEQPGPSIDDLRHPPHIHNIDVECAKDMMTINIEFNREFDGIIYSKGYYSMPECRYVNENSGQTSFSFTVNLNSCGTEFVNAFDTQGQSYLENVLVLQNEPGIQEVWDTIRSVRCLWEGNLKDSLSVALSVGMLSQEIVTFSGDTAMAKLDIQLGKGPFAPPANGLVKIGESMTLVVSVSGDPGFDIQVKDCRATDSTGGNIVPLTDENGCVLKPKLFGSFQKTRNTGDTGASIIAYAFFSAFKFPDVMDLMIECNIELCKTDCDVCPDPNQKVDPQRRKRRDVHLGNQTVGEELTMGKHLRVILPEDLSDSKTFINLNPGVCMSTENFVFSSTLLISLLVSSCFLSVYLWVKNQRLNLKQ